MVAYNPGLSVTSAPAYSPTSRPAYDGGGFQPVLGNLQGWYDFADRTTLTFNFQSITETATGTIGTNTITASADVSGKIEAGNKIRINGTDVYRVSSVVTTTITTAEILVASYSADTIEFAHASQADDKSGNGKDITQGTAINQPIFLDNFVNGHSVLDFTASSSHFLQNTNFTDILNGVDQPYTIFSVLRYDSLGSDRFSFTFSDLSEAAVINILQERQRFSDMYQLIGVDSLGTSIGTTSQIAITGNLDFSTTRSDPSGTGRLQRFLNGVITSDFAANSVTFSGVDTLTVGARNQSTVNSIFMQGQIGEILIYNRAFSDLELSIMHSYLSNKW